MRAHGGEGSRLRAHGAGAWGQGRVQARSVLAGPPHVLQRVCTPRARRTARLLPLLQLAPAAALPPLAARQPCTFHSLPRLVASPACAATPQLGSGVVSQLALAASFPPGLANTVDTRPLYSVFLKYNESYTVSGRIATAFPAAQAAAKLASCPTNPARASSHGHIETIRQGRWRRRRA
jgi:hypothetical protein